MDSVGLSSKYCVFWLDSVGLSKQPEYRHDWIVLDFVGQCFGIVRGPANWIVGLLDLAGNSNEQQLDSVGSSGKIMRNLAWSGLLHSAEH